MKYCPNCGHELAADAKFCPACGYKMTENKANTDAPSQPATAQNVSQSAPIRQETQSQTDQPQLGFIGSVQYILQHVFEFNADVPESRKSVFWWGYLAACIAIMILAFIPVIGWLLGYAMYIVLVSATMRRLAFIGKNTGIAWLWFIPGVNLYPFILMFFDAPNN